jgi:hypothetical protein
MALILYRLDDFTIASDYYYCRLAWVLPRHNTACTPVAKYQQRTPAVITGRMLSHILEYRYYFRHFLIINDVRRLWARRRYLFCFEYIDDFDFIDECRLMPRHWRRFHFSASSRRAQIKLN